MNCPHVVNYTVSSSVHTHRLLFASHYSCVSAAKLKSRLLFRQPHWFLCAPEGLTAVTVTYCGCFHVYHRIIGFLKNDGDSAVAVNICSNYLGMTRHAVDDLTVPHNSETPTTEILISSFRGWGMFFGGVFCIFISPLARLPDYSLPVWLLSVNSASSQLFITGCCLYCVCKV